MDLRRLRAGEWLAVAGGIALIASLFMDWEGGPGAVVVVLLAAPAVLALLLGVLQATQASPARPVAAGVLTVAVGPIGVLVALLSLGGAGSLLALAATLAITAGGWLSIGNEHVRGLPPGPEPEVRPSPGLGGTPRHESGLPTES